jgi:hypothetical protein
MDNNEPKPRLSRPLILVTILLLILIAGGSYLILHRSTTNTSPTVVASSLPTAPEVLTGHIVLSTVQDDTFNSYYFDKLTHRIVAKNTITAPEGLLNGSTYDNAKVQYLANGDAYYRTDTGGGIGSSDDPPLATKIYKYPDTLILDNEKAGGLFNGWLVTKDGSKIYFAKSASSESDASRDLMVLDTKTLAIEKVVTLGNIDAPLAMNADETKILAVDERMTTKDGQTSSGDYYTKIVNLSDKTLSESLLWKQKDVSPFPSFSASSLSFGPNFLKAVGDYRADNKATIRTIDLKDAKETDIYTMQGRGKSEQIEWSPDGMKIIFAVSTFDSTPEDQGIVLYDFATEKSTQLVKSREVLTTFGYSGTARLIPGSYDGNTFLYSIAGRDLGENTVYFYDIASRKEYEVARDLHEVVGSHNY